MSLVALVHSNLIMSCTDKEITSHAYCSVGEKPVKCCSYTAPLAYSQDNRKNKIAAQRNPIQKVRHTHMLIRLLKT